MPVRAQEDAKRGGAHISLRGREPAHTRGRERGGSTSPISRVGDPEEDAAGDF